MLETWVDEEHDLKPFEGELVEVHGVDVEIKVRGGPAYLQGTYIDPNGKRGRATWDEGRDEYTVQTFDGLFLSIPEENLREHEHVESEEGGFDLAWPAGPGTYGTFARRVTRALRKRGYCVIQMFQPDDLRDQALEEARARDDYTLPKKEFEEAYLGRDANSKVAWLKSISKEGANQDDPIVHYNQQLKHLTQVLSHDVGYALDFAPAASRSGTMLRMPLLTPEEQERLDPGSVGEEDISKGKVEKHLNFVQRRRLCMMYWISSEGGSIELVSNDAFDPRTVDLPIAGGKLLIFRHDTMSYSYKPAGSQDLVLQSWLMEEQMSIQLQGFEGTQRGMEQCYGGPAMPTDLQVHVMAINANIPGNGIHREGAWLTYSMQTDGFIEIPIKRYDMSLYFTSDRGQVGKSFSKHSGLVDDENWASLDNEFFGMSPEQAFLFAPCQRKLLEITAELMHFAGYEGVHALKGQNVSLYNATCGLDWDMFHGYWEAPEAWMHANSQGFVTSNRVSHAFALAGPSQDVDTACSSSLVTSNLAHAQVRQHAEKRGNLGMSVTSQNVLTPWPYIGMSMAGMVGPSGRCLTFDQGASGFTRGEGGGGIFLLASDGLQATKDRIAAYCTSFINQDGRSASLTAPNGPSQQLCMRSAMRETDIHPEDLAYVETHGTGTALGDPIETGSCRAVCLKRDVPLPITTAKSHLGHMEGAAGMGNLVKIITAMSYATVAPNVHLKCLNAHIEIHGFPGLWPIEKADLGAEMMTVGTNAFGFGGTNSHANVWARCRFGARSTDRPSRGIVMQNLDAVAVACASCGGSMCWLCGDAIRDGHKAGKHRCLAIREESSSYDVCSNCYSGGYRFGGEHATVWSTLDGDLPSVEDVPADPDESSYEQAF